MPVKFFRFGPAIPQRKLISDIFAIISLAGSIFVHISISLALPYLLRRKHTFISVNLSIRSFQVFFGTILRSDR